MFQRSNGQGKPVPSAQEVSDARFKRFVRDLDSYERKIVFDRTLDSFLDVYSLWKRTRDGALKVRLVMLLFELHRLDAHFECEVSFAEPACAK